jgi:uncharacterized protein (TIGR03382 family)
MAMHALSLARRALFPLAIAISFTGHPTLASSEPVPGRLTRSLTGADPVTLDDFESANLSGTWRFSNGGEFPGATGSIGYGAGRTGRGLVLGYDFTGGGAYVAADLSLTTPLVASGIGFWVRSPAGAQVRLRVTDDTGQTFQYELARPLQASDPAQWYRLGADLSSAQGHWSGANDGVLHLPIHAVALLANRVKDPLGDSGSVVFDDLVAWQSLQLDLDPLGATLDPPPAETARFDDGLGVNIHFTQDDRALDAARAAGFTWVRMDLAWSGIERQVGVYDFSAFDRLLDSLEARGMSALLILDYGNALHQDCAGCAPASAATVTAFGNYCEAAARHFTDRPVRYEVWNEENITGFWKPAPDPAAYAALLREAIARVHAGDPNAAVSTGGLSGFDLSFFRSALSGGAGAGAVGAGVHPYRQSGGETAADDLLLFRALVDQLLPGATAWDTEWGYSSTWYSVNGDGHDPAARQQQALMAVRELLAARALGFPLAIYYDVRDDGTDGTDPEQNFGLLASDYADKPAMVAVRALLSRVHGRTFAGFVPTDLPGIHALRFDGPADALVVLWLDATAASLPVTVPTPTAVESMLGEPVAFQVANGRVSLTLRQSDGPLYVTLPRPTTPPGANGHSGCGAGGAGTAVALLPLGALWLLRRRRVRRARGAAVR